MKSREHSGKGVDVCSGNEHRLTHQAEKGQQRLHEKGWRVADEGVVETTLEEAEGRSENRETKMNLAPQLVCPLRLQSSVTGGISIESDLPQRKYTVMEYCGCVV